MRKRVLLMTGGVLLAGLAMTQDKPRLNPVIELLAAKKPVFGLYAPANPRGGRGGGRGGRGGAAGGAATDTGAARGGGRATADTTPPPPRKTAAELAADAVAYKGADLIFDGTMEGGARFDSSLATFTQFAQGMLAAGYVQKSPTPRISHPLFVKMTEIRGNDQAEAQIAKQLNAGVSGVVFVSVESADEVKRGLAAMRFKSNGGTRPDDVGSAPASWGLNETDYKAKADLWPLNPNGELVNWTIVETHEGLAKVREIAAVKGIGALFPGAGTMRGLFMKDSAGTRVRDNDAWEAGIQKVLAACKEFSVPCGFPVGDPATMELRMKQGFTVFIINWSAGGFAAVEVGRKASGR